MEQVADPRMVLYLMESVLANVSKQRLPGIISLDMESLDIQVDC